MNSKFELNKSSKSYFLLFETIKKYYMKKEEILKSKAFRMLFPLVAVLVVIALWKNGYQFGKWLYAIFN